MWGITFLEFTETVYHLPRAKSYFTIYNLPIIWDTFSEVNGALMFQGLKLHLYRNFNWDATTADEVDWYITAQKSLEKEDPPWTENCGYI